MMSAVTYDSSPVANRYQVNGRSGRCRRTPARIAATADSPSPLYRPILAAQRGTSPVAGTR
jgi:hypothetical protein